MRVNPKRKCVTDDEDDPNVLADGQHMRVPLMMADSASGLPRRRMLDASAYKPGFRSAPARHFDDSELADLAAAARRRTLVYAQKDFTDRHRWRGEAWMQSDESDELYEIEVGKAYDAVAADEDADDIPDDLDREDANGNLYGAGQDSQPSGMRHVRVDGVGEMIVGDSRSRASRPFVGNSNQAVQDAYSAYDQMVSAAWKKGL